MLKQTSAVVIGLAFSMVSVASFADIGRIVVSRTYNGAQAGKMAYSVSRTPGVKSEVTAKATIYSLVSFDAISYRCEVRKPTDSTCVVELLPAK